MLMIIDRVSLARRPKGTLKSAIARSCISNVLDGKLPTMSAIEPGSDSVGVIAGMKMSMMSARDTAATVDPSLLLTKCPMTSPMRMNHEIAIAKTPVIAQMFVRRFNPKNLLPTNMMIMVCKSTTLSVEMKFPKMKEKPVVLLSMFRIKAGLLRSLMVSDVDKIMAANMMKNMRKLGKR